MRELKFRAWDKTRKRMIVVPHLSFGDGGEALTIMIWDKTAEMYDRALVIGESAELMQYTGLKDKNDKEIYEGDIVEMVSLYSDKCIAWVTWGLTEGYYAWAIGETWMLHSNTRRCAVLYPYCQPGNGYELEGIGNIYQNPELLESK